MAVTGTLTNEQICTRALRKIGVVAIDETATSEEIEIAREGLFLMLKGWQNRRLDVFLKSSMSIPCTTSPAHTLDPVRPLEVESVRYNNGSTDLPMTRMTRQEYDDLPLKNVTGTPTQFYYDRQREIARLYVWPVPASVTSETFEITYTREIEDVLLGDTADIPAEWYNATVYGLADQLQDDFEINPPRTAVTMRAREMLEEALGFDREGSVYFAGPYSE